MIDHKPTDAHKLAVCEELNRKLQAEVAELRRHIDEMNEDAGRYFKRVELAESRAKTPTEQAVLDVCENLTDEALNYGISGDFYCPNEYEDICRAELARRAEPRPAPVLRPLAMVEDRTEAQLKADGDWVEPQPAGEEKP